MKYFDTCVTPALLYSLHCFPIPQSQLERLNQLQRKMMRRIIGWRRTEGEEWIDTMRRMKKRLETSQSYYYCVPWAEKYARA